MRNGLHISAGTTRILFLALVGFLFVVARREIPEVQRYLKTARM